MDLGIAGKRAIVCAASKGLGKGCALALAWEGVELTICARTAETLEATAAELGATGVKVTAIACDITTEAGRAQCWPPARARHPGEQCRRAAARRLQGFRARCLAQGGRGQHADAAGADQGHGLRHDGPRLRPDRQHHLGLGEGADRRPRAVQRCARRPHRLRGDAGAQGRGAATSPSTRAARPVRHRPPAYGIAHAAQQSGRPVEQIAAERAKAASGRPLRHADEFGAACAFLCSAQAGFITGQNLLIDGGAYPGTL